MTAMVDDRAAPFASASIRMPGDRPWIGSDSTRHSLARNKTRNAAGHRPLSEMALYDFSLFREPDEDAEADPVADKGGVSARPEGRAADRAGEPENEVIAVGGIRIRRAKENRPAARITG